MNTNSQQKIKCHKIAPGRAEGEVIFSADPICFYLVEPETGEVIEKGHSLEGKSIAGKILVMPAGKGSSVVQADGLYQLAMEDNSPRAIVIEEPDTVLVASAIIMEVPLVDKAGEKFYQLSDGQQVIVDADNEEIIY